MVRALARAVVVNVGAKDPLFARVFSANTKIRQPSLAGWWSPDVIGGITVAAAAGVAFVRRERRVRHPMLDLRLFKDAGLRWGSIAIAAVIFALAGLMFDLTQFLQVVQRFSPLEAGLRILRLVRGFGLAAHLGQHLVRHAGTGRAVAIGFGVTALIMAALSQIGPETAYWPLGIGLFLLGTAMGTIFVPSTVAVMAAVPAADARLGAGLNDTSRQVGAALGIGVLGSLTNAVFASRLGDFVEGSGLDVGATAGLSVVRAMQAADALGGEVGDAFARAVQQAFVDGFGVTMLVAAVLLAAGAIVVGHRLVGSDERAGPSTPSAVGSHGTLDLDAGDRGRVGG